jgi:DNA-binding CsgD family transcriptional regulator
MFDLLSSLGAPLAAPPSTENTYRGPERRGSGMAAWRWLALVLDEIDYGVLLLRDETRVVHVNHVARSELDQAHPLQLLGSELRVRRAQDVAPVLEALADAARRGLRCLLTIGAGLQQVTVAVVPIGSGRADAHRATLLMFGRRQMCEELSVQGFARCHGLTPTETDVLKALCAGAPPRQVAERQGVALSTVRTQISSIRAKTGAESIRALVRQVAVLPPLVSALRGTA